MNKLKTEKGFTLTEVLLAMVIMAIGVVGIFSLQTYSVQTLSISESRLIAQQIGKRYLEEAKIKALIIPETSIGASGLDCGGDKPCPKIISSSGEVKEFATRGISYSVLYKVFKAENSSQCNPGNLEQMRRVELEVTWAEMGKSEGVYFNACVNLLRFKL